MNEPTPQPPPPDAAAADPLAEVVDDDTPLLDAVRWAVEQLYDDHPFDEIEASLRSAGWTDDSAAAIVEAARQQTRRHRGVTTRDQVVFEADRMYRRSTNRWFIGMPMIAAAWRLLHSIATLLSLRRAEKLNRRDS